MKGFYMVYGGNHWFMKSNSFMVTDSLAIDFINKVQNKMNRFTNVGVGNLEFAKRNIHPAKCTIIGDCASVMYSGYYCKESVDFDACNVVEG